LLAHVEVGLLVKKVAILVFELLLHVWTELGFLRLAHKLFVQG